FYCFVRAELDVHLKRGARIDAGIEAPGESPARQRFGAGVVTAATEKLGAVGREAVHALLGREECDAPAELVAPVAPREESARLAIELRRDVRPLLVATAAENPLGVVRRRQAAVARECVLDSKANDLHGSAGRYEDGELLLEPVTLSLVRRVARAVANERLGVAPGRKRRGRPDGRGLFVAQVEDLRRRIEDRIVSPRREAVLAAVDRPRRAERRLAGDAA